MWIMLSDAFISIVAKDCGPDELLVRARRAGDIRKVFGKSVKVTRYTKSDYLYRAVVPKADVAAALARAIDGIEYPNFKDSVKDDKLHDAYLRVWTAMAAVQPLPPYSGDRTLLPAAGVKSNGEFF
jgi:hypothetical protein